MQPWIDGPRRTRRTQRTRRTRRTPAMLDACFRASLLGFGAARRFGMWRCCDTQERGVRSQHIHGGWQSDRCLSGTLVSKQSVAHIRPGTPWHALAHASVETCGFPGFHAGHGLDLVLAVSCMSYRHAVKSSQAERKRRSSAWTKTETFLSSPTMGRRWLPDAACGCKFGNGSVDHASQPVQHCNCRNRTSKQHQT